MPWHFYLVQALAVRHRSFLVLIPLAFYLFVLHLSHHFLVYHLVSAFYQESSSLAQKIPCVLVMFPLVPPPGWFDPYSDCWSQS